MTNSKIAKKLGRAGGLKRAQRLTYQQRSEIGQLGAKARNESIRLARIIRSNFEHVAFIHQFRPLDPVISESAFVGPLPSIHDKAN